jgi:hypothetical protein
MYLEDGEREIRILQQKDSSNCDAIATLSDQVMILMKEIDSLKESE